MARNKKSASKVSERYLEKAFGSASFSSLETGVISVVPPRSAYFEPKRCRITCLDLEDPSQSLDLRIGAVTVGGAPQLGINTLNPQVGSSVNQTVSIYDIDLVDVNWSVFSSRGLARELQFSVCNPNKRRVAAFVSIDGFSHDMLDNLNPTVSWRSHSGNRSEETIIGSEIELAPLEQRAIAISPTVGPCFMPKRIRFSGHRIDTGTSVPFSVIDAYCKGSLLYGAMTHDMVEQMSVADGARHLAKKLEWILQQGSALGLRGILTDHFAGSDGWGDVSWWPMFTTNGLGSSGGCIVYNPWPFSIRASACISGWPGFLKP